MDNAEVVMHMSYRNHCKLELFWETKRLSFSTYFASCLCCLCPILTDAYMVPIERFLSNQNIMCMNLPAHSTFVIVQGTSVVAIQSYLDPLDKHVN